MKLVSLEKESHSAVAAMENRGHRGPQKDPQDPSYSAPRGTTIPSARLVHPPASVPHSGVCFFL